MQYLDWFPKFRSGPVVRTSAKRSNVRKVPHSCPSWGISIGGDQPAQKWLRDRKGRALTFDDVTHDRKIIRILSDTDRILRPATMDLTAR